jgi:CubicO group peptidase (beta-lactamase class C family)
MSAAFSVTPLVARAAAEEVPVDGYLRRAEAFGFSGAVGIITDGSPSAAGYGYADREKRLRYSSDTVFDLGSVTKHMTAAAVLILQRAGTLRVDNPIALYVKDVPSDKSAITLHQLLTHTSGLSRYAGRESDELTRDQLVERVLSSPLATPPGTRFLYSNSGYRLAAAIVEIVAGVSFRDYMREHVFQKAALKSTGFYEDAARWGGVLAQGYYETVPTGSAADGVSTWNSLGSGGVVSTLNDLLRWDRALSSHDVLDDAMTKAMFTGYVESDKPPFRYGYGWYVYESGGKNLAFHSGFDRNFGTEYRRYKTEQLTVVASSNVGYLGGVGQQDPVIGAVSNVLRKRPTPPIPDIISDPLYLQPGRYIIDDANGFTIARELDFTTLTPYGPKACAACYFPGSQARPNMANFDDISRKKLNASGADTLQLDLSGLENPGRRLSVQIRGTGPYPFDASILRTYALVRFERGTLLVTLGYRNGDLFDVSTWPLSNDPGALIAAPVTGTSWRTYDLFTDASAQFVLSRENVRIRDGEGWLEGRRSR